MARDNTDKYLEDLKNKVEKEFFLICNELDRFITEKSNNGLYPSTNRYKLG